MKIKKILNALLVGFCFLFAPHKKNIVVHAIGGNNYFASNIETSVYLFFNPDSDLDSASYLGEINSTNTLVAGGGYNHECYYFLAADDSKSPLTAYKIVSCSFNNINGGDSVLNFEYELINDYTVHFIDSSPGNNVLITFNLLATTETTYTQAQYDNYGREQFDAGKNEILNNPNNYGLYTQQQYDDNHALNSVFDFFRTLAEGLAPILSIELFPGVSMGLILAVPLVFSMLAFIIGMFR